jgi:hypothetical protein
MDLELESGPEALQLLPVEVIVRACDLSTACKTCAPVCTVIFPSP